MGSGKDEVKSRSWKNGKETRRSLLPRLVIAKRYGYDQCGILVPNCYFDGYDKWDAAVSAIARSSATQKTAAEKDPRVFWRGTIGKERCADEGGNFARAEAVERRAGTERRGASRRRRGCRVDRPRTGRGGAAADVRIVRGRVPLRV